MAASRSNLGSRSARLALLDLLLRLKDAGVLTDVDQKLLDDSFENHVEAMITSAVFQNDVDALFPIGARLDPGMLLKCRQAVKERAKVLGDRDLAEVMPSLSALVRSVLINSEVCPAEMDHCGSQCLEF